ncbi:MAG: diguanylate cyclase [Mycobacterium leprae]
MTVEMRFRDSLTGVYSRATLQERLREEVQRARRYKLALSLVLLDLDYLKSINDAFGHRRGDEVLAQFAQRLASLVRDSDLLFRYGGDEFVLLLPHTTKSQAEVLAARLLDGVRSVPFGDKPPIRLSTSMGVASYPDDAETPEALFERADIRHYDAKRSGRGCVVCRDLAPADELLFEEGTRLVEREEGLLTLHHFLEELPEARRGLLVVSGPKGAGHTAFLAEVGKAARLRGYAVWGLKCNRALQARAYGALTEAKRTWEGIPSLVDGSEVFVQGVKEWLDAKDQAGLLITVDGINDLDQPTHDLLRALFVDHSIPELALAYTQGGDALRQGNYLEAPLIESVALEPFSHEGMRIWLRSVLQWEPTTEFLDWFYGQVEGLPAWGRKGLSYLVEKGLLRKGEGGWQISPNIGQVSLAVQLQAGKETIHHNLPSVATSFVGREQEIHDVKRLLQEHRLVTLIGPGGVGKTRLALQIAAELMDQFPGGVFFVPLDPVHSAGFIISTIADAMDFHFRGAEDPKTQLLEFLRDKAVLLVMDNFEHLIEGAPIISEILQASSAVRVLVTSRERLHLQEEWLVELTGLGLPAPDGVDAESSGAVQLFAERARAVDSHFVLDSVVLSHVVQICRMAQGMPLAIELAAAWVRVLSCEEIAAGIASNMDLLATSRPDIPERHRSLRGAFEYSWDLLSEEEQRAFRKLSVFRGGFRREAAGPVAGASLLLLSALMDKSLLRRTSPTRYQIHDLLRQYAGEKLAAHPEEGAEAAHRHAMWYARFLADRAQSVMGERQKAMLEEIGEEVENIRSSWVWVVEHAELEAVAMLADPFFRFHEIRSLFKEGMAAFSWAVRQLRECEAGEALLGGLLTRQGLMAMRLGSYAEAETLTREGVAIARRLSVKADLPFALDSLADACAGVGKLDESIQLYRESLNLLQRNGGHTYEKARALNNLGLVMSQQGKNAEAREMYAEGLAMMKEAGNPWGIVVCLTNLGEIACKLGENQQAWRYLKEGLKGAMELKSEFGALDILVVLATLIAAEGHSELAMGILAFVLNHPAVEDEYKAKAEALFADLAAELPSEESTVARERARTMRLEEVAAELLAE